VGSGADSSGLKSPSPNKKSGPNLRDPLKLDNFEVVISMVKFTIGLGIFNRPYTYHFYGLNNGISSDALLCAITVVSNYNLVESLRLLPRHMRRPNSGLTLGKSVGYILDERSQRADPEAPPS
jgi:hypothetical protein